MAKYSSLKKLKNKPQITNDQYAYIEKTVNETVAYVDQWAQQELLALANANTKTPLCIPMGKTGFLIGKFAVKQIDVNWLLVDTSNNIENIFSSRSSAVIYSLLEYKGQHKFAKEILKYNTDIIKISEDLTTYMYRKNSAKLKHDTWRFDYFYIMENSARYKLEDAKNQLEKSLHLAKYFKIR